MGCCSSSRDACALPAPRQPQSCPSCGRRGKTVTTLTVKSLVRDHTQVSGQERYWSCRAPDCEVVYFGAVGIFRKPDISAKLLDLMERRKVIRIPRIHG